MLDYFKSPIDALSIWSNYHLTVSLKLNNEIEVINQRIVKVYDYSESYMNSFSRKLQRVSWQEMDKPNGCKDKNEVSLEINWKKQKAFPYTYVYFGDNENP